jgi:hypothetical protein
MRTIAASGLIALTAMLGVAASTAVASSATAAPRPAAVSPPPPPPTLPATQLFDVSCLSSKYCVAVGTNSDAAISAKGDGALIQTWNGKTWKTVVPKAPTGGRATQLHGVSCKSATACVAVGVYLNHSGTTVPLIETWNGTTWTSSTTALPKGSIGSQFLSVSCAAAKSCVAVGNYFTEAGDGAMAGYWNGRTWALSRPPEPKGSVAGQLNKVSCTSAAHCIAVGSYGTNTAGFVLADSWNGRTWARMSVPAPASGKNDPDLTGVSCPSAKSCVAVGAGSTGRMGGLTSFAEFWNGRSWTAGKIAWPKGVSNSLLTGVSCTSAKSCLAVGNVDINVNDGGHSGRAAATMWNGRAWTATKVPAPAKGKVNVFTEVTCPSSASCLAVGQLGPFGTDNGIGLAGFWNGKTWKLVTTP